MKEEPQDIQKSRVSEKTALSSEAQGSWSWVEPSVWTERMLDALNHGIQGDKETKWFCLIDKVYHPENLHRAYLKVKRNRGAAGVDHVNVDRFSKGVDGRLEKMGRQLKENRYYPQSIKRVQIPKPGSKEKRLLGVPTVRDRVVQTALRQVIEPIFENEFADNSYGFRPGRGCKDALREVDRLLKEGYTYVVDTDLRKCFDCIDHDRLMERVKERVADRKVLDLIVRFLRQNIMGEEQELEPERTGTPQGGTLSPLLCNIYLNPLDHLMEKYGVRMVRYADDLVILCQSQKDAQRAMDVLSQWVKDNHLDLHPEKTRMVDMAERGSYLDFLGYRFRRTQKGKLIRVVPDKSQKRLREKLRGITRRSNGYSMDDIIGRCNQIVRGWYEYFKHARPSVFGVLDGWLRMRLRSILRGRQKRKGRGRGADHHRWPNRYFEELGLFSMKAARVRESSPR